MLVGIVIESLEQHVVILSELHFFGALTLVELLLCEEMIQETERVTR